ncbi:MAG: hypothetical protein ACPGUD_05080 [Parashewanella sp.]
MPRLFRKSFIDEYEKQQSLAVILPERAFRFFRPITYLFSFALFTILLWLFFAKIDVHVKAKGMILPIGGIRESISLGNGRVIKTYQYANGKIESGDPILTLTDPVAEQAYLSAKSIFKARQAEIEADERKANAKYNEQIFLYHTKIQNSQDSIARLKELKSTFELVLANYQRIGQTTDKSSKADLRKTKQLYQKYISKLKLLKSKGYSSDNTLIPIISKYNSLAQSLSTLEQAEPKLNLNITQQQQQIASLDDDIATQETELKADKNTTEQAKFELSSALAKIAFEQQQAIQKLITLEHKNWVEHHIFTEYDGKLIDTKKRVGQVVSKGETISLLSVSVQQKKKMLIISPHARKGSIHLDIDGQNKNIFFDNDTNIEVMKSIQQQLMSINNIDSVKIKHNAVVFNTNSKPITISQYQLVNDQNIPVFASLETVGEHWKDDQLVNIAILRYQDAKLVNKGDKALIQPLYEKAIIGAKLSAKIQSISPFALTKVQSYSLVGDQDLASKIIGDVPGEVVILKLEKKPDGVYDWGGRTPVRPISPGVPTNAIITIDELAPIEVIIPYIARIFLGRDY